MIFSIAILLSPYDLLFSFANFTLSDFLYLLCFGLVLMDIIMSKEMNEKSVLVNKKFIVIYIMLFFILFGTVISLSKSLNPIESFGYALQYTFIFIILMQVVVYLNKDFNSVKKYLNVFLVSAFPGIFLVILSYLGIYNGIDEIIMGGGSRYVGFNSIATSFGLNTCYIVIISLILAYTSNNINLKILYIIYAISATYCVILSISFSALILLLFGLCLYIYFIISKNSVYKFIYLISFIILMVMMILLYMGKSPINVYNFLPEQVVLRLESSNGEVGSSDLRMQLNLQAINMFLESPLVGVGENQFNKYNVSTRNVHNTVLSAAVETGIWGLIGVIIYLFLPLIWGKRLVEKFKNELRRDVIFIKLLIVLAYMRILQVMFSGPYIQREAWIPILLLLTIYFFYSKKNSKQVLN